MSNCFAAARIGLLLAALAAPAFGQATPPRHVAPVPIDTDVAAGNGHAQTWDGRVFVVTRNYQGNVGWLARVFRPEALTADANGVPQFTPAVASARVPLELNGTPNTGMTDHNALAIVPAPGVGKNPFRSDAAGAPQAGGAYETYELLVITQHYQPSDDRLGRRRARIVVSDPRTANAAIHSAAFLGPLEELVVGASSGPLRGIEPTATFDGHLIVWQGHPDNDGKIDVLMYAYNQTAGARTGWTRPRTISDMFSVDRNVVVAGLPFHERFPLAKRALRAADGQTFAAGQLFRGAYPWVSLDGTELFFTALQAGIPGVNEARRGGFSVIGRWTGNQLRHVDGPLNPDRTARSSNDRVRLFFSSPGASPGLWQAFRDVKGVPIPYTADRPVYPLFGSNTADYGEVSFEDHEDQDYALVLRMNELITKASTVDPSKTPDTSGNSRTGLLEGARFPQEYSNTDANHGRVGQGVYAGDADRVRVVGAPLGQRPTFTAELWVRRLVDMDQDAANRYRFLLHQPGAWHLILEERGRVQATVIVGGQQLRSGPVGPALPLDQWAHVAFSWEASAGRLRVYVDGALVSETTHTPGAPDAATGDLIVGPGGQQPAAPFVPAGQAILLLDELKLSQVERSAREVARSAFLPLAAPSFGGTLPSPLPTGLDPDDLRLPPGQITSEQVGLGKLLFFDPRLSGPGTVSCATCHDPARLFTDGLPQAQGLNGLLKRNTTSVANRAFSTAQFWDGRAASLEAQAVIPLEHPDEMNLPLADAVALLNQIPGYVTLFQSAYGGPPSATLLPRALADYQRSLVSGDAPFDRGALSPAAARGLALFRGKARCTACHTGANFTDERFHNDGFFPDLTRDPGRFEATGRARDLGRFKTPSLRDVSRTAPYLHDGSAPTLADVVALYDRGGVNEQNRDPEIRPLNLSAQEQADLVAFLESLEGTTLDTTPPARLPDGPNGQPAPPVGGTGVAPVATTTTPGTTAPGSTAPPAPTGKRSGGGGCALTRAAAPFSGWGLLGLLGLLALLALGRRRGAAR